MAGSDTATSAAAKPRTPGARKARDAADKHARAQSLIDAARAAMDDGSYHDITMLEIAKRAGLAKGTVYLYFPSKEALFLAVLTRELEAGFESLRSAVADAGPEPEALAAAISRALAGHDVLSNLLGILHNQLEPGAGIEAVRDFKRFIHAHVAEIGAVVDRAGRLPAGEGAVLISRANALAVGLRQMTSPPAIVQEVMDKYPELRGKETTLEAELTASLADMIRGAMARA